MGEQGVNGCEIFERKIGGVAVMGVQHDEACFRARLAGGEEVAGR